MVLLDRRDGSTIEVTVSLSGVRIDRWERIEGVRPTVFLDEFFESEAAIQQDPRVREPLAKRGITDMDLVTIDPWPAGNYGDPVGSERRSIRGLVWVHEREGGNQYARPVDGLMIIVDLLTMEVIRIDDEAVLPAPCPTARPSRR